MKALKCLAVFIPGVLLLGAMCLSLSAAGQEAKPDEKVQAKKEDIGLVVIPVVFYEPETKWAGGVGGLVTFRTPDQDLASRPSSIYFYAIYTQLRQFRTQIEPAFYFRKEAYLLNGKLTIERYPNKFWGFGAGTPESAVQDFTPRKFSLEVSFQKRILARERLYFGLQFQFENLKILESDAGGSIAEGLVPGSKGGTVTGLGFILNWDTRNNIFSPSHGHYFQASTYFNGKILGSDFTFNSVKVDLRAYMRGLALSHVVALQAIYESVVGPVSPFYRYAKMGGDSLMRGYYGGRYRDKYFMAFQAEYRLPVWWRFGLVTFAGLGDVAGDMRHINIYEFKYSAGAGLRFKISPKEGANLRADFAFGHGTTGFYFTANEAF